MLKKPITYLKESNQFRRYFSECQQKILDGLIRDIMDGS